MKEISLKYHRIEIPLEDGMDESRVEQLIKRMKNDTVVRIKGRSIDRNSGDDEGEEKNKKDCEKDEGEEKNNQKYDKNICKANCTDTLLSINSVCTILSAHNLELALHRTSALSTTWRKCYHLKFAASSRFTPGDTLSLYVPYPLHYIRSFMRAVGLNDDLVVVENGQLRYEGTVSVLLCYFMPVIVKKMHLLVLYKGLDGECGTCCGTRTKGGDCDVCTNRVGTAVVKRKLRYLIKHYQHLPPITFPDLILNVGVKGTAILRCCSVGELRNFSLINEVGRDAEIIVGLREDVLMNNCVLVIDGSSASTEGFDVGNGRDSEHGGRVDSSTGAATTANLTNHPTINANNTYHTAPCPRYGKASTYIHTNTPLPLFINVRKNILLTYKPSKRMVMIATGTGVTPFLSFMRNSTCERMLMVYGFRNVEDDIIGECGDVLWYREGLVMWCGDGGDEKKGDEEKGEQEKDEEERGEQERGEEIKQGEESRNRNKGVNGNEDQTCNQTKNDAHGKHSNARNTNIYSKNTSSRRSSHPCTGTTRNVNISSFYAPKHLHGALSVVKVQSKHLYVQSFLNNLLLKDGDDLLFYICGNIDMQKSVYELIKRRWVHAALERRVFFDNWD